MAADKTEYQNKTPETLGSFVMQKKPELLAPAGSPKALRAAINAGADAVYFALPDFNARINADNFTRESFAESVELCHQNGVKAYITLNTQVYDREREDFLKSAEYAYNCGVDAAIVGDLGAASLLHEYIPSLELHASTQLSAHNSASANELRQLGFTRVVLARELSLENIKSFTENSPLEAEIFIHGALCVCHSGQCLFSSLVGGRSGNRGLCAQPCRLPYKNPKGNAYPLSLKDMCLAEHIGEILKSGVASLKIEGRMKPAEYVYGVVSIYRRLLDEGRNATAAELSELQSIFSRGGFTDGYFEGRIDSKMLGIRSEKDKEMSKCAAYDIEKKQRRIGVDISVALKRNEPMKMEIFAPSWGRSATVFGDVPQEAINRPTDAAAAEKSLVKFGSTPFEVRSVNIDIDDGLMIPVSALNALRRKASDAILAVDATQKISVAFKEKKRVCAPSFQRSACFRHAAQIPDAAQNFFDIIYLPMQSFSPPANGVALPPVIFDSELECAERYLGAAKKKGAKYALVGNLGQLALVRKFGLVPMGDLRLNASNSDTAEVLTDTYGVERVMLSPELSLPRLRDIASRVPSAAVVYGRVPLMAVEKCVLSELYPCEFAKRGGEMCRECRSDRGVLVDRTGAKFPVLREFEHRNVIYNSLPTYMADKALPDTLSHHYIFTVESADEAERVIEAYKNHTPPQSPVRRVGV